MKDLNLGTKPAEVRPPYLTILSGRLPSVDGWRAACLMLVLAAHSQGLPGFKEVGGEWWLTHIPLLFDGHLGVRCFFVISGFLITYLLLQEDERFGSVNLKSFYVRRALRILPVYLAYLAVIGILQYFSVVWQEPITWVGDLTFTTNFLPRGFISGHLWSLSVEEQFYLIWPISFVFLKNRTHRFLWILTTPFVVSFFCQLVTYTNNVPWIIHPLFHHHSSLVNFDALGIGGLSALALSKRHRRINDLLSGRNALAAILVGVLLVIMPYFNSGFSLHSSARWAARYNPQALPFCS